MTKIAVAASQNEHKIEEIEKIIEKFGIKVIGRDDFGLPKFKIKEDGETFEANSYKKAYEIWTVCHEMVIADDSGLMVEYLNGEPGVYSARFSGENSTDEENNKKLLKLLEGVPMEQRKAQFVSVITLITQSGKKIVAKGICKGHIIEESRGNDGFGYDPLFVPEGENRTFAELSSNEKNKISHRANALRKLEELLKEIG